MPLPERTWLHHDIPSWVRNCDEIFFITVCAAPRGTRQLIEPEIANTLIDSVAHRHDAKECWVHLFVVMPDHVHGLLSFPSAEHGMKRTIANWKRWTARRLKIEWQPGFFDHRLRGNESFDEKADYIRMNPVRAGLVARPEDWPHIWSAR